jgi:ankyrin repeat protein
MHWAVDQGRLEIIQLLLDHSEADVNKADNFGITPLHEAVNRGSKEIVQLLLNKGADPKRANNGGLTPMHWAVDQGRLEIIQLLLDYSEADVYKADNFGITPLHAAVRKGSKEIVQLLLKRGANPRIKDLQIAVQYGATPENREKAQAIIRLLIQHNVPLPSDILTQKYPQWVRDIIDEPSKPSIPSQPR